MKGLSFFDLIFVVAFLLIAASIVLGPLADFYAVTHLQGAGEEGLSLLLKARSKTLSSQEESQYGVHVETNRMVLFKGTVFVDGAPENEEALLSSKVEVSNIALNGGGADVIFNRLTGATSNYGTITLRLISDPVRTRVITIHPTGIITL